MSKKFLSITIASASVCLLAFVAILIVLALNNFSALSVDTAVQNWAYDIRGEKGNSTYWFFRIVTEFGYVYFAVAICIVMGIIWRFKAKTWFFSGTVLISWLLQKLLKWLINRPRPDESMWWMVESSSSFPSGHSITIACIAVLVIFFLLSSNAKLWLKILGTSLMSAITLLVPLSRIILGMHYFTDCLAGLFFGVFVAILGIIAYQIYKDKQTKKLVKDFKEKQKQLYKN